MASRTAILRGPAIVQFNSVDFYSQGDIEVEIDEESFEIITSAYGKVDERIANRIAKVRFTPAGEWESLATLFPYASTIVGASIFTGTDVPLAIQTLDGRKITFQAAALTKMPDLILSAVKTAFGQVEFTCIGKDNTAWSTASSFVAVTSVSMPASTFDPAAVKISPWTAAWGVTTPWDGFQSKDGFSVNWDLKFGRLDTDTDGLVDMMFESLAVMVKAQAIVSVPTPGGITEQNVIDALIIQGAGAVRGKSYQALANNANLVLTATDGRTFTANKASMKGTGFKFGATTVRQGESAWIATRALSAGVIGPLFAIT